MNEKPELQSVTPEEFIMNLERAPAWVLQKSPTDPYALELYVMDGDNIKGYLTPNLITMSEFEFKTFFIGLKRLASTDEEERFDVARAKVTFRR